MPRLSRLNALGVLHHVMGRELREERYASLGVCFPLFQTAPLLEHLFYALFITPVCRRIEKPAFKFFRQIGLRNICIFIIMGIHVIFSIPEFFHQPGRCIPDMKRGRQCSITINNFFNFSVSHVDAVALRGRSKIYGGLCQREFTLRMS